MTIGDKQHSLFIGLSIVAMDVCGCYQLFLLISLWSTSYHHLMKEVNVLPHPIRWSIFFAKSKKKQCWNSIVCILNRLMKQLIAVSNILDAYIHVILMLLTGFIYRVFWLFFFFFFVNGVYIRLYSSFMHFLRISPTQFLFIYCSLQKRIHWVLPGILCPHLQHSKQRGRSAVF